MKSGEIITITTIIEIRSCPMNALLAATHLNYDMKRIVLNGFCHIRRERNKKICGSDIAQVWRVWKYL